MMKKSGVDIPILVHDRSRCHMNELYDHSSSFLVVEIHVKLILSERKDKQM